MSRFLLVLFVFALHNAPGAFAQPNAPQAGAGTDRLAGFRIDQAYEAALSRRGALRIQRLADRTADRRRTKPVWQPAASLAAAARMDEQDSLALVALYQSAGGSSWADDSGWLTGPVGTWYGVTVDATGRVTSVALSGNGLFGSMPADLGQLDALQNLDLSDNVVLGSIPAELGDLAQLQILDLSFNALSGELPESLGQLSSLTHLVLWGNALSGAIPPTLGDLSELQELWLFQNRLTGAVPPELGGLTQLRKLYLDQNELSGAIPETLADLPNLSELFLDVNALSGEIPAVLSSLSNLQVLALGGNQLDGGIPPEIGSLQKLLILELSNNRLTGGIPESLTTISTLSALLLSDNELTGELPLGLAQMSNMTRLHLGGNQFTGSLFSSLGARLFNLTELDVSGNQLRSEVPPFIGSLSVLQYLDLSHNQFFGELPLFETNFGLRKIYLNDNEIAGTIETAFNNLELIEELDLSNNQFVGPIPRSIGGKQILKRLVLNSNEFSGEIPSIVERLPFLETLDLWNNRFSGPLPAELGNLNSLKIADLGRNEFSGEIPSELGEIASLEYLALDENALEGAVPASFSGLSNLAVLALHNNNLDDLPDLSNLVNLGFVDVGGNRLTFEDIEPNVDLAGGNLVYAPQAPVPTMVDRDGDGMNYAVQVGGTANLYQWYRRGSVVDGAEDARLSLGADAGAAMDTVFSRITNRIATALTLESLPVRTDAILSRIEVSPDSVALATGDSLRFTYQGFDQFANTRFFTGRWAAGGGVISEDGWYAAGDTSGVYEVRALNIDGSVIGLAKVTIDGIVDPVSIEDEGVPVGFRVHSLYPNPFGETVHIMVELPAVLDVELRVFDALGREVTRRSHPAMPAGAHTIRIEGDAWSAGVYFCRITAGTFEVVRSIAKLSE